MEEKRYRNRIFVAEDYPEIMAAYKIMLEMEFSETPTEFFKDGTSLVDRLNQNPTDLGLVLTDNQMPGINGSKIIEDYAKDPRFENVRFVLATGDGAEAGQKALKDGAHGYLAKPVSFEEVTKMVRSALEEA